MDGADKDGNGERKDAARNEVELKRLIKDCNSVISYQQEIINTPASKYGLTGMDEKSPTVQKQRATAQKLIEEAKKRREGYEAELRTLGRHDSDERKDASPPSGTVVQELGKDWKIYRTPRGTYVAWNAKSGDSSNPFTDVVKAENFIRSQSRNDSDETTIQQRLDAMAEQVNGLGQVAAKVVERMDAKTPDPLTLSNWEWKRKQYLEGKITEAEFYHIKKAAEKAGVDVRAGWPSAR